MGNKITGDGDQIRFLSVNMTDCINEEIPGQPGAEMEIADLNDPVTIKFPWQSGDGDWDRVDIYPVFQVWPIKIPGDTESFYSYWIMDDGS